MIIMKSYMEMVQMVRTKYDSELDLWSKWQKEWLIIRVKHQSTKKFSCCTVPASNSRSQHSHYGLNYTCFPETLYPMIKFLHRYGKNKKNQRTRRFSQEFT